MFEGQGKGKVMHGLGGLLDSLDAQHHVEMSCVCAPGLGDYFCVFLCLVSPTPCRVGI